MPYDEEALMSLNDTLELMNGTLKSGNKKYELPILERLKHGFGEHPRAEAHERRNRNVILANIELDQIRRAYAGKTTIDAGAMLYIQAFHSPETFAANCGEQAAITIYFAHAKYNVPLARLWLYTLTGQHIAHSFCLITSQDYDTFANLPALANVNGWIVDPWMRLMCEPHAYVDRAGEKLTKWDKVFKRLPIVHPNGAAEWVDPTDPRIVQFLQGAADADRADQ